VAKWKKVLIQVLRGTSDATIPFEDLRGLLCRYGFQERIRGSHHIFFAEGIEEILNIQPKGNLAKAYQVKQVRNLIVKYQLGESLDDEI